MNITDLTKPAKLHKDLKPYLCNERGMLCLKHPLVFAVPYTEALNNLYNEQHKYKLKYIDDCKKNGKWSQFLFMYERPHRFEILAQIQENLTDKEYWKLLGDCWSDTENMWQMLPLVKLLLKSNKLHREYMMNKEEKAFLQTLPDQFIVYRGCQNNNKNGVCWTLSYRHACWFSTRFHTTGQVVKAICPKTKVLACFLGRKEFEIAVFPKNLKQKQKIKIDHPPFIQGVIDQFKLNLKSDHGLWHWESVAQKVSVLADLTPGADKGVCLLFAWLHDSRRTHEIEDNNHGILAAGYVKSLYKNEILKITPAQLEVLCEACAFHTAGTTTDDPTIGCCWDADRLDLVRVGVVPDPAFLSTQSAQDNIWNV